MAPHSPPTSPSSVVETPPRTALFLEATPRAWNSPPEITSQLAQTHTVTSPETFIANVTSPETLITKVTSPETLVAEMTSRKTLHVTELTRSRRQTQSFHATTMTPRKPHDDGSNDDRSEQPKSDLDDEEEEGRCHHRLTHVTKKNHVIPAACTSWRLTTTTAATPAATATATATATAVTVLSVARVLVTALALLAFCTRHARASHVYLNMRKSQPPASLNSLEETLASLTSLTSTAAEAGTRRARPSPSDTLPIQDLLENPDEALNPTLKDLDPDVLRRRLGSQLDEEFLSIERPADAANSSFGFKLVSGRPDEPKPAFLKLLRTFRLAGGVGGGGRRGRWLKSGGKKQRRRLQKLVWSYTFCPVQRTWKDLGSRFWPRWLREGACWRGGQRSCSMPPGMTCQPAASLAKTLLRWHCRSRGGGGRARGSSSSSSTTTTSHSNSNSNSRRRPQCRWIRVQYPIITKCSCAC